MQIMELSPEQVTDLARPFIGKVEALNSFYADPQNRKAYREWYKDKYGNYPPDAV